MPVTGATTRNDYSASSGQTVFAFTINKPTDGGGTGVVVPHLGVVAELSPNLSLQVAD